MIMLREAVPWSGTALAALLVSAGVALAGQPRLYTLHIRPDVGTRYQAECRFGPGDDEVLVWQGDRAEVREIRGIGLACTITQLTDGGGVRVEVHGPGGGRSTITTRGVGATSRLFMG